MRVLSERIAQMIRSRSLASLGTAVVPVLPRAEAMGWRRGDRFSRWASAKAPAEIRHKSPEAFPSGPPARLAFT